MITAKSSFDLKRVGSEYKNLLRRGRGITIFYTVLTFIFFTLQYILSLLEHFERISYGGTVRWNLIGPGGLLNGLSVVFFCSAVIGVSIGAAVDVFSYMQNRRSTDVYHSLPLTRDELLTNVWGYEFTGDTNIVDVYIRYLRQKIDDKFGIKTIHTIRAVGYMFRYEQKA